MNRVRKESVRWLCQIKNVYETAIKVPGEYRLYVYVLDNTGFVSTANIPFQVID